MSGHRGERRYVGGPMDGEVERLVSAAPGDYPLFWQYPRHPGGIYERADLDGGTAATYVWRAEGVSSGA